MKIIFCVFVLIFSSIVVHAQKIQDLQWIKASHSDAILKIAYSHDGKHIASVSADKSVKIWNTETGNCEGFAFGNFSEIRFLEFSENNDKILVTTGYEIYEYDSPTCTNMRKYIGERQVDYPISVYYGAYIPQKNSVLGILHSGIDTLTDGIYIWNCETGEERKLRSISGESSNFPFFNNTIVSPDGQSLVYSWEGVLRKIDLQNNSETKIDSLPNISTYKVRKPSFSKNGDKLYFLEYFLYCYDFGSGSLTRLFNTSTISDYTVTPNNEAIFVSAYRKILELQPNGDTIKVIEDYTNGEFENIALSPDGKNLLIGSKNINGLYNVAWPRLWTVNIVTNTVKKYYGVHNFMPSVHFSYDDKYLISTGTDGENSPNLALKVFDIQDGNLTKTKTLNYSSFGYFYNSVSPAAPYISYCDSIVRIWDYENDMVITSIAEDIYKQLRKKSQSAIRFVTFSPDGNLLAIDGPDNFLRIWDWENQSIVDSIRLPNDMFDYSWYATKFTPDGKRVVFQSEEYTDPNTLKAILNVYDLEQKAIKKYYVKAGFSSYALNNDYLFIAENPENIKMMDINTGEFERNFIYPDATTQTVYRPMNKCSSDGKYLFSITSDGKVLCWNIQTATVIKKYDEYPMIGEIAISHNNENLAGGTYDASVILMKTEGITSYISETQNIIKSRENFPNPAENFTTISFSLPHDSKVKISLYDATGSEIKIIAEENFPRGENRVLLNTHEFPSGVYYYRLTTLTHIETKILSIVR